MTESQRVLWFEMGLRSKNREKEKKSKSIKCLKIIGKIIANVWSEANILAVP